MWRGQGTRDDLTGLTDQRRCGRPKKIDEGGWVLVYDSNLDNQHKAMRKFVRRWFEPYAVISANDNGTYHLVELDGTRIVVLVAGKRMKAFKKRQEGEPEPKGVEDDDDRIAADDDSKSER